MMICFSILTHTWGILMTLIGYLASLILLIAKQKPRMHNGCIIFVLGENWGGITLGNTIIVNKQNSDTIITHEKGHYVQNALMGPLFIFIVAIPSLLRASHRNYKQKRGAVLKTDYDDIWFEGSATALGKYIERKFF